MSTWGTEIEKVKNDVLNALGKGVSSFIGVFSKTAGRAIDDVKVFFKNGGTTIVGINVGSIPSMKTAITNYTASVDSVLNELDAVDTNGAFKGEYATAVKEYILAVKETCMAIVSNMRAFNDQLTQVQAAYEAKDAAMKQTINSDASATKSQFTRYTEQS